MEVVEPANLVALVVLLIVSRLVQFTFAKRTLRREEYVGSHQSSKDDSSSEETRGYTDKERVKKEKDEKAGKE